MTGINAHLAHVLVAINREYEIAAAGTARPTIVVYDNLLRVIPDGGIPLSELPKAARVSRRAIKSKVGVPRGAVSSTSLPPRDQLWRLTDVGRGLEKRGRALVDRAEERFRTKIGATAVELRTALERFVGDLELELPHFPMPYGPADGSAIGGNSKAAIAGPPRVPAHGRDWFPVLRGPGDTVTDLPLHALASQAAMAFKIDYEEMAEYPLTSAASLAAVMPEGTAPLHVVGPQLGVNGSGRGSLERHGIVRVTSEGVVELTSRGQALVEGHEPRLRAVADGWRGRYGSDKVDAIEYSLLAVDSQLPDDLPDHLVVAYWGLLSV